jgi:hypothetical protein
MRHASRRKGGAQGADPIHWIMSNTDRLHEVTDKVDITHVPPLLTMPPLPIHLPAGKEWHAPQGWPYSMPVVAPLIAAARKGVALGEVRASFTVSVRVCAPSSLRRLCSCRSCMNAEGQMSGRLASTAHIPARIILDLGPGPNVLCFSHLTTCGRQRGRQS